MIEREICRMGASARFVAAIPFVLLRTVAHESTSPRLANDQPYRFETCVYLARRGNRYAMLCGQLAMRR